MHPERDSFCMTDALMQVSAHDLDHLEQITRVLSQVSAHLMRAESIAIYAFQIFCVRGAG